MLIEKNIFREYDIRGIVEEELNALSVKLIGYYLGKEIQKISQQKSAIVSIGYDARNHSVELFEYLTSGLNYAGCDVLGMGMVSTGVNYFSNYQSYNNKEPNASIMITGSHNPANYNGFKITVNKYPFFGEMIYQLRDTIIKNCNIDIPDNTYYTPIDVKTDYINWMVNHFIDLQGMKDKIVIDCGNGVADTVLTSILVKLGISYKALFAKPDGNFPNHHPDPSDEKNLIDLKKELEDDIRYGFAYDGDADRIAFLTQKYNVKGDIMALLFASQMNKPIVIGEVKCSQIMYNIIRDNGGQAIMHKTGHSNLKVKIKEVNADLAAEVSGHIFFADRYFGFDDAIYATFRFLELIKNGINIDSFIESLPKVYSTDEIKIETTEDEKFIIIENLKKILQNPSTEFPTIKEIIDVDGIRVVFEDGWGLVRASNTTPLLITRFESTIEDHVAIYRDAVNDLIDQAKDMV